MKRIIWAAILATASLTLPAAALATTLDQANTPVFNSGYSAFTREGNPVREVGQGFTAGLTGTLSQIDLAIWRGWLYAGATPVAPFVTDATLSVYTGSGLLLGRKTFGGIPLGDVGGFGPPGSAGLSVTVGLGELAIPVVAGNAYIWTIKSTALVGAGFGGNNLNLLGTSGAGSYAGGNALFRFGETGGFSLFTGDINFNTYVDVAAPGIPEPASWAMLIAGFGLIGGVSRRQRAVAA